MERGRTDGGSERTTSDAPADGDATVDGELAERDGAAGAGGRSGPSRCRRQVLASVGVASASLLAGCGTLLEGSDGDDGGDGTTSELDISQFRGSGPMVEARDPPGGTSIADLPDLSGEIQCYVSVGEGGLYLDLFDIFEEIYPDFSVSTDQDRSGGLANRIVQEYEADAVQRDVFVAVDAGALGTVAEAGATRSLPEGVTDAVDQRLRTDTWTGIAGRARAVPFNTDQLSASDVPGAVADFPDVGAFQDAFGWAPTYPAFQSFVTAMRLLQGEEATREWLVAMREAGATQYQSEFHVSNAVANGELAAGFANHYYALRVRNQRPNAPIELAFTDGDAGALINVSAAAALEGTDNPDLADNFLRHLVSAEAQEFFATRTFAYPTISGVAPVGGLPPIDELNPPAVDLADLADAEATVELLRDTNVLG